MTGVSSPWGKNKRIPQKQLAGWGAGTRRLVGERLEFHFRTKRRYLKFQWLKKALAPPSVPGCGARKGPGRGILGKNEIVSLTTGTRVSDPKKGSSTQGPTT